MADGEPLIGASVAQVAGGVAHDLNNLLGGIINYAELVADELSSALERPGSDPALPAVLADTHEIVRVTRRAADLVQQLNRLAESEATALSDPSSGADGVRRDTGGQLEMGEDDHGLG